MLLDAQHVHKHYDGAVALRDASLTIAPGEIHALMGENGAGKSTLSKILAGALLADSAELTWQGNRVRIQTPADAQRLGIGIVFQELDLFPHLSVAENIVIGNRNVERKQWVNRRELAKFCEPHLAAVGLAVPADTPVFKLSVAQKQLVAIARVLSFQAQLILLDEPTSSLPEDAVANLFTLLRRLKASGVSIVYVSHKMAEIFEICDRITVMRDGATIGTRGAHETTSDELIAMLVGRELRAAEELRPCDAHEILLSVRNVQTKKLRNVSFDVRRGEVLGVAGLVGAGRTELGEALFGLAPLESGTIQLRGKALAPHSPRHAIRCGIGLLPEDRKLEGLMMSRSVLENTTIATLNRLQRWGFVQKCEEAARMRNVHQGVALKAASLHQRVSSLSGGNQQKVLLSKWLLADPEVLFLDDPTRGIDIGAKQDIYAIVRDLATQGKGILFVSSELPELLQVCHRIMVLREGRSMGILDRSDATQERIMQLATETGVAA